MTTFARACPVSLSRNPLSPGIEATPKTDLSLSRSLVHRQTWRLTGNIITYKRQNYMTMSCSQLFVWGQLPLLTHLSPPTVQASYRIRSKRVRWSSQVCKRINEESPGELFQVRCSCFPSSAVSRLCFPSPSFSCPCFTPSSVSCTYFP